MGTPSPEFLSSPILFLAASDWPRGRLGEVPTRTHTGSLPRGMSLGLTSQVVSLVGLCFPDRQTWQSLSLPGKMSMRGPPNHPTLEVPRPPNHPSFHAAEVPPLSVSPASGPVGRCRCPVAAESGTVLLWALGKAGHREPGAGLCRQANGTPPGVQLQRLPHRLWPQLQNKRLASAQKLGWEFLEGAGALIVVFRISPLGPTPS